MIKEVGVQHLEGKDFLLVCELVNNRVPISFEYYEQPILEA